MIQLPLRLSCCTSSKKSKPDLQWSLESFSFDFFNIGANNSDRRGLQNFTQTFPLQKKRKALGKLRARLPRCRRRPKNQQGAWQNLAQPKRAQHPKRPPTGKKQNRSGSHSEQTASGAKRIFLGSGQRRKTCRTSPPRRLCPPPKGGPGSGALNRLN